MNNNENKKNEPQILKITNIVGKDAICLFEIPKIQRRFVWKPSQIENLWDSLFRQFPIGAIVAAENQRNGKIELYDGQQRITSILLGFADTNSEKCEILKSSLKNVRVFIDMARPISQTDNKHFIFRVITRSHPWGYQKTNNTKTLTTHNRNNAIKLWGEKDIFAENILDEAYPYDAVCPLPLNIFTSLALENKSVDIVKTKIYEWIFSKSNQKVDDKSIYNWFLKYKNLQEKCIDEFYKIEEIYEKAENLIEDFRIPMLVMPNIDNIAKDNEDLQSNNFNEEQTDAIEEVFVRLNSSGTQLLGEELRYSILKSKIDGNIQVVIEEKCEGIMTPSRFITLVYNLWQKNTDLRIKPRNFQQKMKSEVRDFERFINEKIFAEKLLEKVKRFLKYGDDSIKNYDCNISDYRLPYPLFIEIASASQGEIMFILMWRILYGNDEFQYNTDEHRKMIGVVLLFMWNGKDERSKYNKLINKIWRNVTDLNFEDIWNKNKIMENVETKEKVMELPINNKFFDIIKNVDENTNIWDKIDKKDKEFVYNVMANRDILYWIQRKYLSDTNCFNEKSFDLDDTNVPFDFDHISANNFVYKKIKTPAPFNHWNNIYQLPANLRILDYRTNRIAQDEVPSKKFANDDNEQLFEKFFVSSEWRNYDENWLFNKYKLDKDNSRWREVYNLILNRWIAMYDEFVKELRIQKLNNA